MWVPIFIEFVVCVSFHHFFFPFQLPILFFNRIFSRTEEEDRRPVLILDSEKLVVVVNLRFSMRFLTLKSLFDLFCYHRCLCFDSLDCRCRHYLINSPFLFSSAWYQCCFYSSFRSWFRKSSLVMNRFTDLLIFFLEAPVISAVPSGF